MEVNKENYEKVLKASGVTIPSYWFDLMANSLQGKNVGDLLQVSGGSGSQGVAQPQGGAQVAQKAEEKPKTEEEEEDVDMGGFFD